MKIGVFGGTFDPVHLGHLVLAEYVRDGADLDKVIIMPAFVSPFKIGKNGTPADKRLEMATLAVENNDNLEVSPFEIELSRVSYTVDTLRDFKKAYYPEDTICFIAGTDSFLGIGRWKGTEELLSTYSFAVGNRPGYREDELSSYVDSLKKKYDADISIISVPQIDVSSTEIRSRVKNGNSIRYLVSYNVEKYIDENGLYRD